MRILFTKINIQRISFSNLTRRRSYSCLGCQKTNKQKTIIPNNCTMLHLHQHHLHLFEFCASEHFVSTPKHAISEVLSQRSTLSCMWPKHLCPGGVVGPQPKHRSDPISGPGTLFSEEPFSGGPPGARALLAPGSYSDGTPKPGV